MNNPPCFSTEEWTNYTDACRLSQGRPKPAFSMCTDCTPKYKAEMGPRCTHPDVRFCRISGGIVGQGKGIMRINDDEKI